MQMKFQKAASLDNPPPTEKQITLLETLGIKVPATKKQATQLISEYMEMAAYGWMTPLGQDGELDDIFGMYDLQEF